MSSVSLQRMPLKFQEEPSDLEALLLELGFLCEKDDAMQMIFYTGKEKNEESSLYYCEQRYYAAHISRWVSTDPTWLEDGINLYAYVHGNPLSGVDPSGTETENNEATVSDEYNDDNAKENLINAIRENIVFLKKFTVFGKILFAIDCLIPISIVTLVVLFILVIEIDDKWKTYGSSLSFEKRKSSFDLMTLPFVEEIVVENEKIITLFGTKNIFKSENNKPLVLRTADGGESWKKREIDIDIQSASFDYIGEHVYMIGFVDNNDSVSRPVYVSNGDFKKWEYIGDAEYEQLGKIHVNKAGGADSLSIILERDNTPTINLGNLCNGAKKYAQNDKDWIVCGFDEKNTSTHDVRILHRTDGKYRIYTSIPDKWHLWRLNYAKPLDFYVKDSLMVGIFKFWMGAGAWFRYLYYSVDGGRNWQNKKIPSFTKERLAIIKNNIIVLGVNYSHNEKEGKVTILTMPIPKK